eukprot:gene18268-20088_t
MEESADMDLCEELKFLHLTDETSSSQKLELRVLVFKLWKLTLNHLYGGSSTQRKWLLDILKDTNLYLVGESSDFSEEIISYLEKEEFEDKAKAILLALKTEECFEENLQLSIKDLIALSVQSGIYDARYRTAVRAMSHATDTKWDKIDEFEKSLVEKLAAIKTEEEERAKKVKSEQDKRNMKRAFVIGLTAVGGGAILALSAGLAAPLIGAGAVAVLGSSSAAILTGTSGVAIIASIFGAAGAGLTGFKMTKRIGKIEQFEFASLSNDQHLHITLAVSGFCSSDDDSGFSTPWESLDNSSEQYSLVWEGKYLRLLGSSIIDFVKREAMQAAVKEILRYTALRAVLKSIAWPLTLISAANIIDNPWNVCTQRSKEAGIQLAHVLLNRHQGYRPITLVGFSLGARAIFYCLQAMLAEKDYQGIIEDVILMGAPVGVVKSEWEALEAVISGTLYNCYSRSDWLLKFVYRAASIQVGDIAGLGPVELSWPRVENIDLGDIIKSHSDYSEATTISQILDMVGVKTKPVETALESGESTINPKDIVKQISKKPKDILTTAPLFSNKQSCVNAELTAEEQETLERLVSCKSSSSSLSSWRMKEAEQNTCTDLQPCTTVSAGEQQPCSSPFRKVFSLPKRIGLATKANFTKQDCLDCPQGDAIEKDKGRHKAFDKTNKKCKRMLKSSKQAAISIFSNNSPPLHSCSATEVLNDESSCSDTVGERACDVKVDMNKDELKQLSLFGKFRKNLDSTVSKQLNKLSRENSLEDISEVTMK